MVTDGFATVSAFLLGPHDQCPADRTGIQRLLFLYPSFNAYLTLPADIFHNMLVMAYPVYNMGVAENRQSFTRKVRAFIAPGNAMFFCTVPEAMAAIDTRLCYMIR